jgi:tripartite-type tricarboxylate transporter receptor subunit TctC
MRVPTLSNPLRRTALLGFIAAACTLALPAQAAPQWPTHPVTIILPFSPGGGTDLATRLVAQRLAQMWGQPVLVDNRPGAAGNVGLDLASRAKPDGYTLVAGNIGTQSINPSLYKKLNYNPDTAFEPVSLMAELPFVLVVTPGLPAKTPRELVALARAKPGKLTYASSGTGGSPHLSAEIFKAATGTDILHIPYKGGGAAMTDLMAGNVDMLIASILETAGHVKGGKLRALAVTGKTRSESLPSVPTMIEAGVSGYSALTWNGLLAPAGTPPEIVARLNDAIVKAMRTPAMKELLAKIGQDPAWSTPQEFAAFLREETDKWSKVINATGIKAQ